MSLLRFRAVIWFRGHTTCDEMRERIERVIRTHPHLSFRADKVEVFPNVTPGTEMFDPATITPLFEPGGSCLDPAVAVPDETCVAAASAEALEFSPRWQPHGNRDGWCASTQPGFKEWNRHPASGCLCGGMFCRCLSTCLPCNRRLFLVSSAELPQ